MNQQTLQIAFSCLLGGGGTENTAARFARQVSQAMIREDGAQRYLRPVFTRINGAHPGWALPAEPQDGVLRMPVPEKGASGCEKLKSELNAALDRLPREESRLEELLDTLERYGSAIPAADDISLYDQRKITAAIACCASEYLRAEAVALRPETELFLLYTADFSGIQKFIYTVSTTNALRALRSRSFFLELTMEHYIDELLTACGLSRANLLYSGGGHCYLLLPNTEAVKETIRDWNTRFNNWLMTHFGIQLYLADGYTACCANDLTNSPAAEAPYQAIFRRVSGAVARQKVCRYSTAQLRILNAESSGKNERECRVCGSSRRLTFDGSDGSICQWCSLFESFSSKILSSDVFLASADEGGDFTLPGIQRNVSFRFLSRNQAEKAAGASGVLRCYCKNQMVSGLPHGIRIFVGDYAAQTKMELLAQSADGISRIAVCRMDVDNLGQAFVSGFEQQEATRSDARMRYVTLTRTSAFSRQMSLFFKCYVNQILSGSYGNQTPLQVAVVYSGGDDVFLVGAWTDVITAALRIRNAFHAYTCGALTLSAGICLFQDHHPIRLAANQTAELEDEAKRFPGKNAVSIFAPDQGHVYSWDVFEKRVREEKQGLLGRFFGTPDNARGNTFLYNLVTLLREANAQTGKGIALARLAYTLARLEPSKSSDAWSVYREFSDKIYDWALDPAQRRELITAIYLFIYQTRKKGV